MHDDALVTSLVETADHGQTGKPSSSANAGPTASM